MSRNLPTVKGVTASRLLTGDEARLKAAVEYVVHGLASGALKRSSIVHSIRNNGEVPAIW